MCEACEAWATEMRLDPAFVHDAIMKADDDPLTRTGMLRWEIRIEKAILAAVTPVLDGAFKQLFRMVKSEDPETDGAEKRIKAGVGKILSGIGHDVVSAVEDSKIPKLREGIAKRTRESIAAEHGLETIFPKEDKKALGLLGEFNNFWLRDHFNDDVVKKAKAIVAREFENGDDRRKIAKALKAAFEGELVPKNYWRVVSSAWSVQVRTLQSLRTYDEVGITEYEFYNINDARTSEVCRPLIGKRWSVKKALKQFEALMETRDRAEAESLSPWVARDKDGSYIKRGDDKVYLSEMSDKELGEAGILWPPRHGHCRSSIIAVTK